MNGFFRYYVVVITFRIVLSSSLHPRRPQTEEEFLKLGHHEAATNIEDMIKKLNIVHNRRNWKHWNLDNSITRQHYSDYLEEYRNKSSQRPPQRQKPPNILFLFADDLGYGDLGVKPFTYDVDDKWPCSEGGILTPNLQRMANQGTIATNFHSASPVCSPSRVSMLTGLYPWRLGALFAFELGKDLSQRNGFLPQIYATIPELFRNAGYKTMHSGKWHLGGMREEYRVDRVYRDKCTYPSPNQAGFDEYISELDGPESPRYTFLLRNCQLHTKGHRHLLKDDVPMPMIDDPKGKQNVLSDHEAGNAIKYIQYHQKHYPRQPWYIQVWFNAPHGPWERLDSGQEVYSQHYGKTEQYWNEYRCDNGKESLQERRWWYKTMITAMDKSIGKLLNTIKELGIEEDTLIVFTSDNGPEAGAGTAGPYRGIKRSLLEGGIRVPAIFQWVGTIPSNSITTSWGAIPDLLPTFLDAASIHRPTDLFIDGVSYLPVLTQAIKLDKLMAYHKSDHFQSTSLGKSQTNRRFRLLSSSNTSTTTSSNSKVIQHSNLLEQPGISSKEFQAMLRDLYKLEHHTQHHHVNNPFNISYSSIYDHHLHLQTQQRHFITTKFGSNGVSIWPGIDSSRNRVFLWQYDGDPYDSREARYQSAAYYNEVKILTSTQRGCLDRIYDLRHDPYEQHSLITQPFKCVVSFEKYGMEQYRNAIDLGAVRRHCEESSKNTMGYSGKSNRRLNENDSKEEGIKSCLAKYSMNLFQKIEIMFPKLMAFAKYGNHAHQLYMTEDKDKVTCDVPMLNQTKKLKYLTSNTCLVEHTCSMPEY